MEKDKKSKNIKFQLKVEAGILNSDSGFNYLKDAISKIEIGEDCFIELESYSYYSEEDVTLINISTNIPHIFFAAELVSKQFNRRKRYIKNK